MYQHILLPTDGSPLAERAIVNGVELARRLSARVTGHYVTPASHVSEGDEGGVVDPESAVEVGRMAENRARKYLASIERAAQAAGVPCRCLHVTGSSPYAEIIRAAEA
jgi:nucleotide-binding universal stress UspA family protein